MKLQSKLFGSFDPTSADNSEFTKDLKLFVSILDAQRREFMNAFPRLKDSNTEEEVQAIVQELTEKTGLSKLELSGLQRLVDFFLRSLIKVEEEVDWAAENVEIWSTDLREMNIITEAEAMVLAKSLLDFKTEFLSQLRSIVNRRTFSAGVLPSLRSFGSTSELRTIRNRRLSWSGVPEDYIFDYGDFLAVGSIHLGADSGNPKDFVFQVDEHQLMNLITGLQKLLIELRELKRIKCKLIE